MKYMKLFSTSAEYEAFIAGDQFVTPNISFIPTERLAKYTPIPKPKPEPKVTLEYNCSEDNLYAFSNGVQNVKKLTIDGNNVDFEPLQQNNYTIDILSSNISKVTDGGYIVPENYFILHPPTSLAIKLADATSVLDIDNFFLLQLFTGPGMESVMGMPMPLSEYIESGMLILNDNNSISFGQDQLTSVNTVVNMSGYKVTYCFADTNYSPIDTVIEYEGTTGGIPLPYSFETPGQHTVELELFDDQFGALGMFSEFPNNDYDASLTSVTFNESISFIHNGTFICDNLTHITCKSKTAPILLQNTNGETDINVPYFGTLVYPKGSDYSSWLDVNNGFGMYGWNQEQPVITCTYNVTDTTKPTQICYGLSNYNGDYFSEIKVDDVLMVNQSTEVTFTTVQEHIVTFKLKQMTIPNDAFRDCYNLTKVSISSNLNKIGDLAFSGCSGLTSIVIPNSVTYISHGAFNDCSSLTSINIPDSVKTIGNVTFSGCSGLKTIVIPDSVTSIGNHAFEDCSGLTSINIPNGVTEIGSYAFYGCSGLTSINIPDSVTYIGGYAFYGCSSLTSINIPDGVTAIGDYTFYDCRALTSIVIPDSVTTIWEWVFYGCSGLTSINIPDGVTSIGESAFRNCSGLTSINIPYSVTTINNRTFEGCTGLTSIVIPDSVTSIGTSAFANCSGLTSVTIGSGVTSIDTHAFNYCTGLTSIVIPDSVTSIDYGAFYGCSGLTDLTIGTGVTSIGQYTFYNCRALTSIVIPDSVTSIGTSAFSGCSGLTGVTIGSGVTSISSYTFNGCSGLKSIVIPDSVTSIGDQVFYNCTGLTSIVIPNGVTEIGSYAFYGCSGLTSIICYAPTAPSIQPDTFCQVPKGGTLYVPLGSDYSSWMSTNNYYLGSYNWTTQMITAIENKLTYGQKSRAETEWLIYAEYPVESDLVITATYEHPMNGTQTHNYTMSKGNTQSNESFSAMVEYTNIVVSPQQDGKYIYIV